MTGTTTVSAGRALLGESLRVVEDVRLTIEGGRIAAIEASETEVPAGAELVDASSLTVLPGFIDAHVHIGFYDPAEVLLNGVTTARDLGWPPDASLRLSSLRLSSLRLSSLRLSVFIAPKGNRTPVPTLKEWCPSR